MATIKINTKGAEIKLNKLLSEIQEKGEVTVEELAQVGKQTARSLAPYDTGETFRRIRIRRDMGPFAVVFAGNPTANDGHQRRLANFNLVRWMHTSSKALSHIKSGDPRFMYRTREILEGMKGKIAGKYFNKIKL